MCQALRYQNHCKVLTQCISIWYAELSDFCDSFTYYHLGKNEQNKPLFASSIFDCSPRIMEVGLKLALIMEM